MGSMRNPDLTAHDFEKLIVKHGGKKGWLRSIEHLLEFTFRRAATSAPQSAALVETMQSGPMREKPTGFVGYKVGAHLKRRNELGRLQPPRHVMTRGVEETNDWKNNPLSYNDHKAVCNDMFWWVVLNFKSVKKCILMFRELGKHLNTEFPKTSQKVWMTKLHNRWKNGLRTSAKVIAALAPTTFQLQSEPLCPSHTAHPPPSRVCPSLQTMYKTLSLSPDDIPDEITALAAEGFHVPTDASCQPKFLTFAVGEDTSTDSESNLENADPNPSAQRTLQPPNAPAVDHSEPATTGQSVPGKRAAAPSIAARKRSREEKGNELAERAKSISSAQPSVSEAPSDEELGAPLPSFAGSEDAPTVKSPAAAAKLNQVKPPRKPAAKKPAAKKARSKIGSKAFCTDAARTRACSKGEAASGAAGKAARSAGSPTPTCNPHLQPTPAPCQP